MFDSSLLTTDYPTVTTPLLSRLQLRHISIDDYETASAEFKQLAQAWLQGSQRNQLQGFEKFSCVDIVMGCNHYIDNLIMRHGLDGLQIFEHDYRYYERLHPGRTWSKPGELIENRPVLIAMPAPGFAGPRPQQQEILDEAWVKNCPVHLDCSWITACKNIDFDFAHPAIHSFAMSFSKGMNLWWNRIGLRWSRVNDSTDSITIYNNHNMIPLTLMETAINYLKQVPVDHVWNTYENLYNQICKELKLRPTNIVHVAQSIDRKNMYGMKQLLEKHLETN